MTRTYATTNIVIDCRRSIAPRVFAVDFSVETPASLALTDDEKVRMRRGGVDPAHLRYFGSMRDFTEWLFEAGAIVDKAIVFTVGQYA